jgi:undecaprenyl-diphosphatase
MWVASLKEWAAPGHYRKGALLPVKRLITFLFFRERGEELFMVFLIATFFLATWGFLGVLQDVLAEDPLVATDQAVKNFFEALRTPWSDSIFVTLTELGDAFVNISLSIAVLVTLVFGRAYRTAVFWIFAVLGGLTGVQLLKWAINLPRPIEIYEGISSYGFPSGHVAMSIVIYGFLFVVLSRGLPGSRRWKALPVVVVYSSIIGISRLYLGVHWLSDVLGGLFIATMWVTLLGIAYVKGVSEAVPRRAVAMTAVLVLALAGGFHVGQRHEKDLAFYAPVTSEKIMRFSDWRDDGWRDLAAWRIDLAGEREQPLTVQFAGDIDELEGFLLQKGWEKPKPLNLRNLLTMLSPGTPLGELPSLPLLHDGRAERLRLLLEDSEKQYMLRLWPSGVVLGGFNIPVFVGTVEDQRPHEVAALITAAKDIGDYDHPLDVLEQVAIDQWQLDRVFRQSDTDSLSPKGSRLRWQGEVLLMWK